MRLAAVLVAVAGRLPGAGPDCDPSFRLDAVAEEGALAVRILLTNADFVYAGSLGIGYDRATLWALSTEPVGVLSDLGGGAGPQYLGIGSPGDVAGCPYDGGVTVRWVNAVPLRGEPIAPGAGAAILRIAFRQSPEGPAGRATAVEPTDCFSDAAGPVDVSLMIWPDGAPRAETVRPCAKPAIIAMPCAYALTVRRTERTRFVQRVSLKNAEPVHAGSFGIGFDGDVLDVRAVVGGPVLEALNGGEGPELLVVDTEADSSLCEGPWTRGIAVGWMNNLTTPPQGIPAGEGECLRIVFSARPGVEPGRRSPIDILGCLRTGVRDDPLSVNISLIDRPVVPCVEGSVIEIPAPVRLIRGDANADGRVDIADAIRDLTCLFSSTMCPRCLDTLDANDNGLAEISDPIGVLNHLFAGGPPPAPPFPDCGLDETGDPLLCEEGPAGCGS